MALKAVGAVALLTLGPGQEDVPAVGAETLFIARRRVLGSAP